MKKTILSLLSAAFALTAFASCSSNDDNATPKKQTYVLVHGAWQASYVWDAVRTDLVKEGHQVIVVELPGHGTDNTPANTLSLDAYRDKVIEAILQVEGKVILAGHSMGGMVVTAVAEKVPAKISKLVYIGAFVPASGQALADIRDPQSQLGASLVPSEDHLKLNVKQVDLTRLFINDGDQAAKQKVIDNYRAEPAIPFSNPVTITNANFGSVEKVYIKTLQDIVISPALQDQMIALAGITRVYTINTSHSPFLSQPRTVSSLLLTIGQ